MNTTEQLRNQATGRYVILALAAVLADLIAGWAIAPVLLIFIIAFGPLVISTAAYFVARTYEWSKLGVTEDYGQAAYKKMQAQMQADLHESLDDIGKEALEEVNRAIERREEGRAEQG